MATLTKSRLQHILTDGLDLDTPRFLLEKFGKKLSGSIISRTFKGKGDLKRQKMIWDVLDAELGPESVHSVGMLLAYTPDEWDIDLEFDEMKRSAVAKR